MGVTGLWTVVQPCARPVKIETLNKKRLAVDASIWIYQFLKAVRDKEGNALRNSHVVGFFRRICKLLFFGIKPVFVFDGGAPALKRQTISGRKQRREGRREDAVRTAGKLLALQMQRRAEEEEQRRREEEEGPTRREQEEEVPENPVYVDELGMSQKERDQSRKFKKKDQYHLPDLGASLSEMGQPNDPRVMSMEELEQYARQFDTGEDINVYDFSKIDFNSPFFQSLPNTDRYNILNAARLRSRLRMGYSKDQLENMFPDRMAFSRFQIDRVKERNELTQRLMHVTGMNDNMVGVDGTGRIAGEKGREYVLVRSSGVDGGWALGVIGDKDEGERSKPIDVDKPEKVEEEDEKGESDDDIGFEDVPIEGLNRLPKLPQRTVPTSKNSTADILRRREAVYKSRESSNHTTSRRPAPTQQTPAAQEDEDALFVDQGIDQSEGASSVQDLGEEEDPEELQRAIAMSLEGNDKRSSHEVEVDDWEDVLDERTKLPFPPTNDRRGATQEINERYGSLKQSNKAHGDGANLKDLRRTFVDPRRTQPDFDENDMAKAVIGRSSDEQEERKMQDQRQKFDGPLPFESLSLGSSLLGKKKMKKIEEDQAGGFDKVAGKGDEKELNAAPPWFANTRDVKQDLDAAREIERQDRVRERREREKEQFDFGQRQPLQAKQPEDFINVDAIEDKAQSDDVISITSSEGEERAQGDVQPTFVEDNDVRMGDIADLARVEPPIEDDKVAADKQIDQAPNGDEASIAVQRPEAVEKNAPARAAEPQATDDEALEWEESDREDGGTSHSTVAAPVEPAGGHRGRKRSRSPSMVFETVDLEKEEAPRQRTPSSKPQEDDGSEEEYVPKSGTADQGGQPPVDSDDEQFFSDDEDDELMLQMANETEEHARFASQLNQTKGTTSTRQNVEEYERELKALRSQQQKDRRDADEVTHIMVTECQQLLKLFGLPYITAPMEAEAQCAELVHLGLVDGIVTDDSDIFLFGGTRIYKNMFNQAKFVECYLASDLEREFDLTREKMIRIAHLLGSDYTEGLPGIGPVTALEIISDFPEGLAQFKDWWSHVQTGAPASDEDLASSFRKKFRKNSTKLFLPPVFPDLRVDAAYLEPEVDADPSAFQWGVPDLDALRSYLMATIGWTQERTDEVLVPVVRDLNRRENEGTQANITSFLGGRGASGAGAFAPRRRDVGKSKRMEGALEKLARSARQRRMEQMGGGVKQANGTPEGVSAGDAVIAVAGSAVPDDLTKQTSAAGRKRKVGRNASGATADDDTDDDEPPGKQKKTHSGRSKRRAAATSGK